MAKLLIVRSHPTFQMQGDSFIDGSARIGKDVRIGHFVSIHAGVKIGDGSRIEDGARIYDNCVIGDNCIIGPNAVLRPGTQIGSHSIFGSLSCSEGGNSIGDYTTIHAQCHITRGVRIGNNVFIAPFFIATNTPAITEGKHGTTSVDFKLLETEIGDNVRMGANVRLIPGRRIGAFSIIDQDTLITKDVPPHSHVRGGKDKVGAIIGKA